MNTSEAKKLTHLAERELQQAKEAHQQTRVEAYLHLLIYLDGIAGQSIAPGYFDLVDSPIDLPETLDASQLSGQDQAYLSILTRDLEAA